MTKFKINNIYNDEGFSLEEIMSKIFLNYLENDFDFNKDSATMTLDTVLNN